MTEVASSGPLHPPGHKLALVKRYEAVVPSQEVGPGDTFATTKEEEWISKKKTEVINTKQIETRVKRQVVLEDGKVVEDSGPQVTTNTTEDTETQEHHQTELRKLGDDGTNKDGDALGALEATSPTKSSTDLVDGCPKSNWVAVPNPDGIVREVKEKKTVSREETEEVKETEDVQHLGDITDEDFLAAVKSGRSDLREVLRASAVSAVGPRVLKDTAKTSKVTDTEETRELSSVRPDGKIVTETQRTTEHEELDDRELPENAEDVNKHKESSERFFKAREQEDVDYYADGVKIGHEMRFKAETTEGERRGDGQDEPDWDSLSARARRRSNQQRLHRYRGLDGGPMDRMDALTKRPLDFDQEEETRKVETSKWLENHFGSESRSSKDSADDDVEDEKQPPKTSFFNVTIKSAPSAGNNYFKGVSDWSERRAGVVRNKSPAPDYRNASPVQLDYRLGNGDYRKAHNGVQYSSDYRVQHNGDYRVQHQHHSSNGDFRRVSPVPDYRGRLSPAPDYRGRNSPLVDRERETPTPPQRKRISERRQRSSQESRYDSGYRTPSRTDGRDEPLQEPPPDYSPPSPPPILHHEKKVHQKTRFADTAKENAKEELTRTTSNNSSATTAVTTATTTTQKQKSGNIIGQSIRKLVGKIRSASAERKAKQQQQRIKRSPSPSYQAGHPIDRDIPQNPMDKPVQRYYLGEDPFAGSIYGRENKYDGVKPARSSRRQHHNGKENGRSDYHEERSHQQHTSSTLGRFGRRQPGVQQEQRFSQTLPRHATRYESEEAPTKLGNRSSSTINVSIINTVKPPAKPARTYKANLARSKSFNVQPGSLHSSAMYKSNPQLSKLHDGSGGLKSPGLISSLSRSQRDLQETSEEHNVTNTSRFLGRNGHADVMTGDHRKVFMKDLKSRAPELFKTLHENEDEGYKSILKTTSRYSGDIYEPPTRLREAGGFVTSTPQRSKSPTANLTLRRGSNSSDNYSETYHTTTRNDDPLRPSVTNTVQSFTKKTLPSRNGRSTETIESTEKRSVTKSHYRGDPVTRPYYDSESSQRYGSVSPVVIEVRNYNRK